MLIHNAGSPTRLDILSTQPSSQSRLHLLLSSTLIAPRIATGHVGRSISSTILNFEQGGKYGWWPLRNDTLSRGVQRLFSEKAVRLRLPSPRPTPRGSFQSAVHLIRCCGGGQRGHTDCVRLASSSKPLTVLNQSHAMPTISVCAEPRVPVPS